MLHCHCDVQDCIHELSMKLASLCNTHHPPPLSLSLCIISYCVIFAVCSLSHWCPFKRGANSDCGGHGWAHVWTWRGMPRGNTTAAWRAWQEGGHCLCGGGLPKRQIIPAGFLPALSQCQCKLTGGDICDELWGHNTSQWNYPFVTMNWLGQATWCLAHTI